MLQQDILKLYRKKYNYTQTALADQLHVSPQAISKWETGDSLPSIDNLLASSDLYNISLDELVQAGPYFKKPFTVGHRVSWKRLVIFVLVWTLFSLFVTGFGYQPWWLFAVIMLWGLVVVLPIIFDSYWTIERTHISATILSGRFFEKFSQLLKHDMKEKVNYSDITLITIRYIAKVETSPWDFWRDELVLDLVTNANTTIRLPVSVPASTFLPQLIMFLQRQHIDVEDPQGIVDKLLLGENLHDKFHEK